MKILTKKTVLLLHEAQVQRFGGSAGIRDDGLLESAIAAQTASFGGQDLYPTILEKAAQLCFRIMRNHPFVDGNKRTAVHAMLVFLVLNGASLQFGDDDLIDVAYRVAASNGDAETLLSWVSAHTV